MTAEVVLDVLLGVGVLLTAAVALFHPHRMSSVAVFLGFGVLVAAVWARLGAPDVALAEASLAAGVTGALLMAAVGATPTEPTSDAWSPRRVLAGLAEAAVAVGVGAALTAVLVPAARTSDGPPTVATAASDAVDDSVVTHPVTAVLLDFRAYDTLLEIVVLAVAATVALAQHEGGSLRAVDVPRDRRPILVAAVRALTPVLVILAAWLLVAGSTRPGGAFQAGAVLTGLALLAVFTGTVRIPSGPWSRLGVVVGAAVFVALAVITAVTGTWLELGRSWGGPVVVAVEVALAISIGLCLAVLLLAGFGSRTARAR